MARREVARTASRFVDRVLRPSLTTLVHKAERLNEHLVYLVADILNEVGLTLLLMSGYGAVAIPPDRDIGRLA